VVTSVCMEELVVSGCDFVPLLCVMTSVVSSIGSDSEVTSLVRSLVSDCFGIYCASRKEAEELGDEEATAVAVGGVCKFFEVIAMDDTLAGD
jgi:hypothetical protein